jgi:hypothetical protein
MFDAVMARKVADFVQVFVPASRNDGTVVVPHIDLHQHPASQSVLSGLGILKIIRAQGACAMDCSTQRQVERQASRLSEMITQLNVDRGKLVRCRAGAAFTEAREKCLNCSHTRECLAWLDARQPGRSTPWFCPNASLLEACRSSSPDWQI